MSDGDLVLTEQERQQILAQRQSADRKRWIVEGMFLAVDHLGRLGDESCGGDGQATNPKTGMAWGEPYYMAAEALKKRAAYLSANPSEINA